MKPLMTHLKAMNLAAHNMHNLAARVPFFADHEKLAEFYEKYDDDFDGTVERYIGLNGSESLNLNEIHMLACQKLQTIPAQFKENGDMFRTLLILEQELCKIIEEYLISMKVSEGTRQMLGEICNQSEVRQYLIKQRVKK